MSPYVTAFYDAFSIYGQALKETIQTSLDYNDAREINKKIWNRTFQGEFKRLRETILRECLDIFKSDNTRFIYFYNIRRSWW